MATPPRFLPDDSPTHAEIESVKRGAEKAGDSEATDQITPVPEIRAGKGETNDDLSKQDPGPPVVCASPVGYKLAWPDLGIEIEVGRLKSNGEKLSCNLAVFLEPKPGVKKMVHVSRENLLATSLQNLKRELEEKGPRLNWPALIAQVRHEVVKRENQGVPLVPLDSDQKAEPPRYLIYPLLPEKQTTILYADGGSGKSYVSLFLAMILAAGWSDNPWQLQCDKEQLKVAILDWESSKDDTNWRQFKLQRGNDFPPTPEQIYYRPCARPLLDDLDNLMEEIREKEIQLVIVDSVGKATGGDLNQSESVFGFFQAIRSLGVTVLGIHHVNKTDPKSCYGSVYYKDLSRNVWELRKSEGSCTDRLELWLQNVKNNINKNAEQLGFEFAFDNTPNSEMVHVTRIPKVLYSNTKPTGKNPSNPKRILALLEGGPMSKADISVALKLGEDTIKTTLGRLQKDGKVHHQPGDHNKPMWSITSKPPAVSS